MNKSKFINIASIGLTVIGAILSICNSKVDDMKLDEKIDAKVDEKFKATQSEENEEEIES